MNRSWLGRAEVEPKGEAIAGSLGTWKITYYVDRFGVDDGGSIRIARRSVSDLEEPQFKAPHLSGYTSVETTADVRLEVEYNARGYIRPWRGVLQIDVRDGSLYEGDIVTVIFGDRSQGGPGMRMQTFREEKHLFKVLVDCFGTGRFEEIEVQPRIRIIGGPADEIQLASPSESVIGEPFPITVRAIDSWGNRSDGYKGKVSFSSSDSKASLPEKYSFSGHEGGVKRFEGVILGTEGVQTIAVEDDEGQIGVSNPIIVWKASPNLRLFWGDFHGQTKQTVGTGSLDEYFRFVRDVAAMDFSAWQGNDFQVTKELWEDVKVVVRKYNESDRFITFLGYEWSGLTPAGGDHNIYFLEDDEEIHRSNHWLIKDKSDEDSDRYPISELWATFRARKNVMAVAHVGGRHANLDFYDPEMVPLIEVHSHHGTFEWFLEEAIKRGLKVGFVANSDDHTCRPGLTYASDRFTTKGGYTGVYAKALTRDALWEAFWARRCYATTGERIILWVDVNGHVMGEHFMGNEKPQINVRIIGTAPLHEVEVKRGLETIHRHPFAQPKQEDEKLIKIEWSGARVRSRLKRVDWTGGLHLDKGRIISYREFAFDYAHQGTRRLTNQRLEWTSTTGGDPDGVILELNAPEDAKINFYSKPISFSFSIGDIEYKPLIMDAGGVNQKVKVSTITRKELPRKLEFSFVDKDPRMGVNPYWVRMVQGNGAMAWSTPIYYENKP